MISKIEYGQLSRLFEFSLLCILLGTRNTTVLLACKCEEWIVIVSNLGFSRSLAHATQGKPFKADTTESPLSITTESAQGLYRSPIGAGKFNTNKP